MRTRFAGQVTSSYGFAIFNSMRNGQAAGAAPRDVFSVARS